MLSKLKRYADRLLSRPADFLADHRITPNVLTLIGLVIGVIAGVVLALGSFVTGGILILLTGLVDTLDGAVARNRRAVTAFGATFDSIADRYVDCFILLVLKEYLGKRGLLLPDFKLEFGKARGGKILVADEISCDTCRLWLKESRQSVDKDVFRYERGDLITAYQEAAKRILR